MSVKKEVLKQKPKISLLDFSESVKNKPNFNAHLETASYPKPSHVLEKKINDWQTKSLLEMDKNKIINKYFELIQKNGTETSITNFKRIDPKSKRLKKKNNKTISDEICKQQLLERLEDINELSQKSHSNYTEIIHKPSSNWLNTYLRGKRLVKSEWNASDFKLQDYIDSNIFNNNIYDENCKLLIDWKKLDMEPLKIGDFIVLNVLDPSTVVDKFKIGIILKLPFGNDPDIIMYCSDGDLYHLNPKSIILKLGRLMKIDDSNVTTLFEHFYETYHNKPKNLKIQEFLNNCNLDIIPKSFQKIFYTIFYNIKTDIITNYHLVDHFINKLNLIECNDIESLYIKVNKKINIVDGKYKYLDNYYDASVMISLLLNVLSKNNVLYTNIRGVPTSFSPKIDNQNSSNKKKNAIFNYLINGKRNISNKLYMVEKLMKMDISSNKIGKLNLDDLYEKEQLENGYDIDLTKNPFNNELNKKSEPEKLNLTIKDVEELDIAPSKTNSFNLPVYCIDSADTTEVDDGISIENISKKHIRIHCHIASLGRFFLGMEKNEIKNSIFNDALKTATSTYLPDSSDPMIKEENIVGFYSLDPTRKENKSLSFKVDFKKQKDGWIFDKDSFFIDEYDLLVNVQRYTYEKTDFMIKKDPDFKLLSAISNNLKKKRTANSPVAEMDFSPKSKIEIDRTKNVIKRVLENSFTPSQILVSEIMLLFNYLVADYCVKKQIPIIFRVNDPPLKQSIKKPEKYTINKSKLGVVKPIDPIFIKHPASEYSIHPREHYATNLPQYTHITSPLRRIVDTINHIEILKYIRTGKLDNQIEVKNKLKLYLNRYIQSSMKVAKTNSSRSNNYYVLQSLKQGNVLKKLLEKGGVVVDSPINHTESESDNLNKPDDNLEVEDLPSDDIEIKRSISIINVDKDADNFFAKGKKQVGKEEKELIIGDSKHLYVKFDNGIIAKLEPLDNSKIIKVGDKVKNLSLLRLDSIAGEFFVTL
ncbi:hypothetical protein ACO0SA_002247 [Hanseniaspora valbyensis]